MAKVKEAGVNEWFVKVGVIVKDPFVGRGIEKFPFASEVPDAEIVPVIANETPERPIFEALDIRPDAE